MMSVYHLVAPPARYLGKLTLLLSQKSLSAAGHRENFPRILQRYMLVLLAREST